MSMARRNILAALALIAFCAWYAVLAEALPERSLPNTPGPSFFPLLIIACVFALSLALLVKGLRGLRADGGEQAQAGNSRQPFAALAGFVVYLAALPYAGFIIASVVFFAALMLLYGARRHALTALAALAFPIVLYFIFRYGFHIVLPRGPLAF